MKRQFSLHCSGGIFIPFLLLMYILTVAVVFKDSKISEHSLELRHFLLSNFRRWRWNFCMFLSPQVTTHFQTNMLSAVAADSSPFPSEASSGLGPPFSIEELVAMELFS